MGFVFNNKDVVIYNAKTLEEKYRYSIVPFDGDDMIYMYNLILSTRWTYLLARNYRSEILFYNGKTGEPSHKIPPQVPYYDRFINSNEVIGIEYVYGETNSMKIWTYNVEKQTFSEKAVYDKYYYGMIFSSDGRSALIENEGAVFYIDLQKDHDSFHKIIDGYDFIKSKTVNRDSISIMYVQDGKTYLSLYNKDFLRFRKKIEMNNYEYPSACNATDTGQVVYIDGYRKVFIIDENNSMNLEFEHRIHFHYPKIFYGFEKNEIWCQSLNEPKVINRYVFINSITAYSITDEVYHERNSWFSLSSGYIELLLTYEKWHRVAKLELFHYSGRPLLSRMKKSILFTSLPDSSILSLAMLRVYHNTDNGELWIMLHYNNVLRFFIPQTSKIKKVIEGTYGINNIIRFRDRMYFWEYDGRCIYWIDTSITKDDKAYIRKVYDAKNGIKLCKKNPSPGYSEALMITDEERYLKILEYDTNKKKLTVKNEYYAHYYFGCYEYYGSNLSTYQYVDGILYNNYEAYLLQERGTEKDDIRICNTVKSFD